MWTQDIMPTAPNGEISLADTTDIFCCFFLWSSKYPCDVRIPIPELYDKKAESARLN